MNPVAFKASCSSKDDSNLIGGLVCERTKLTGPAGIQNAVGTGELEHFLPVDLALVSIGYKGIAIDGVEDFFDETRGIVRNEQGRVDPATDKLCGLYVSGWLKRGPSGIIGTNIADAKETVQSIVQDLKNEEPRENKRGMVVDLFDLLIQRRVNVVDWSGYQKINRYETESKRSEEQPREKLVSVKEMIRISR